MKGRRPHPVDAKELRGTKRADRDGAKGKPPEYQALEELPPPPGWLVREEAQAEWDRLGPMVLEVMTTPDLGAFAHLCYLRGEVQWKATTGQESPPASMWAQIRAYETEFGLTPASRRQVSAVKGKAKPPTAFSGRGRKRG